MKRHPSMVSRSSQPVFPPTSRGYKALNKTVLSGLSEDKNLIWHWQKWSRAFKRVFPVYFSLLLLLIWTTRCISVLAVLTGQNNCAWVHQPSAITQRQTPKSDKSELTTQLIHSHPAKHFHLMPDLSGHRAHSGHKEHRWGLMGTVTWEKHIRGNA